MTPTATKSTITIDPKLDLVLERVVDVPKELVWQCWTVPEHLMPWFCPKPWLTTECNIDLRPGGKFRTVMRGPNGEKQDNTGCFLEIIPNERLVWTAALGTGFRPNAMGEHDFPFTAVISLETVAGGTKYTAHVMHSIEADAKKHAEMGFHGGWGSALDQMVAMIKAR
jgi:uncharacterized protein YndB with AHSA1/START domain